MKSLQPKRLQAFLLRATFVAGLKILLLEPAHTVAR